MSRSSSKSLNNNLPSLIKEGPIRKSGPLVIHLNDRNSTKTTTQKYYFVLKTNLYYYENQHSYENNEDPLGIIYLNEYYCERSSSVQDFVFTIYAYPKSVTLQVGSDGELKEWMYALLEIPDLTLTSNL